jgi:hypothetical protein
MSNVQLTKKVFFLLSLGIGAFFQSAPLMIISGAFLLLLVIERQLNIYIPTSISVVTVSFIIVSLVFGSYFDFYERFTQLDDLLHGFYGAAFAVIGFIVIQYISALHGIRNDIMIVCLFSFCFAVTGGALWEIYEYGFDTFTGGNMQRVNFGTGVTDTMHDIILETTAAFVINLYIYAYLKTGARNWVSRFSTDFIKINLTTAGRKR